MKPQTVTTVSPSLGKASLKAGLLAGLLGLLLVMAYTIFYYRALGVVVVSGLITTGALIYAIISILGHTSSNLTLDLSGVTGLIVSVGITVDSYIVYFERLKDEVRAGRSVRSSVDKGFKSAFRTIIAADIVSLLGALVLWLLSIGAVRGFAFMLGLSTIIDIDHGLRLHPAARHPARSQPAVHRGPRPRGRPRPRRQPGVLLVSATADTVVAAGKRPGLFHRLYYGETKFDFVRRRRWWFGISAIIIAVGIISLGVRGLNFSIEFVGGTSWEVTANGTTVQQAEDLMTSLHYPGATVTLLGQGKNAKLSVQTKLASGHGTSNVSFNQATKVANSLAELTHTPASEVSIQQVGPTWGSQITHKAIEALIVFLIVIAAYISLFFEWKMAVAAIIAVAHDIIIDRGHLFALRLPRDPGHRRRLPDGPRLLPLRHDRRVRPGPGQLARASARPAGSPTPTSSTSR